MVADSNEHDAMNEPRKRKQNTYMKIISAGDAFKEPSGMPIAHKRAVSEVSNVAFTAYIDHDLDNQGPNQVLVYNKVLLNYANGYSNSGVFTAPVSGVYSFSFFIGQRDNNQFLVSLIVNNQQMLDAICETMHATQDLEGGNTANLLLSRGDSVFIRHVSAVGTHVEAGDNERVTSFSGFLIYPVEMPSEVLG